MFIYLFLFVCLFVFFLFMFKLHSGFWLCVFNVGLALAEPSPLRGSVSVLRSSTSLLRSLWYCPWDFAVRGNWVSSMWVRTVICLSVFICLFIYLFREYPVCFFFYHCVYIVISFNFISLVIHFIVELMFI